MDKLTDKDYWKIKSLTNTIESGISVRNVKGDLPTIVNLNIANLHLVMLCKRRGDNSYDFWDYFNKKIDVCVLDENNEKIPVSQYSLIKATDFLSADNLNLKNIISDFMQLKPHQLMVEDANLVMLE